MPKKQSENIHKVIDEIRTSNAQNGLSGSSHQINKHYINSIDNYFLMLEKTVKKITLKEKNHLKANMAFDIKKLTMDICHINSNGCTQNFIDELVVPLLKTYEEQWYLIIEYWLQRIFYLYKTINSLSGKGVGFNYLIDKNLDLNEEFENIKQIIEKSNDKQKIINLYKENISNLRIETLSTTISHNFLFNTFKKIAFSKNSEPPISSLLKINEKIIDQIIEIDKNRLHAFKMSMKDPLNVVSKIDMKTSLNVVSNTTANFPYVNTTTSPFSVNLVSPSKVDIKKTELFEDVSSQSWTFAKIGFGLGGLIIASAYYFFNKRNRQPETTDDAKTNKECKSLIV